jgi:membrane protein implicated in regulation of membrane protease activity
VKPWIWIAAGLALAAMELVIPSFTIIWFGLSAVVVGLVSYLAAVQSLPVQLALWAVLSIVFTFAWFKFFRQETKTLSGQSKDAIIGKSGVVIKVNDSTFHNGVIRFPIAVLGSDEWPYVTDDLLQTGDRGVIADIAGGKLVVKKG